MPCQALSHFTLILGVNQLCLGISPESEMMTGWLWVCTCLLTRQHFSTFVHIYYHIKQKQTLLLGPWIYTQWGGKVHSWIQSNHKGGIAQGWLEGMYSLNRKFFSICGSHIPLSSAMPDGSQICLSIGETLNINWITSMSSETTPN